MVIKLLRYKGLYIINIFEKTYLLNKIEKLFSTFYQDFYGFFTFVW